MCGIIGLHNLKGHYARGLVVDVATDLPACGTNGRTRRNTESCSKITDGRVIGMLMYTGWWCLERATRVTGWQDFLLLYRRVVHK